MPIPESVSVPYPPDADYNKQMYEVPGTKKPGQTGMYPPRRESPRRSLTVCAAHYRNSTRVPRVAIARY